MEDLLEWAGRTLMVGIPGPSLDGRTRASLERLRPGGVILFRRNLEDPAQLARLNTAWPRSATPAFRPRT